MKTKEISFPVHAAAGDVSALLLKPRNACCLYVFAHGAGADMRHSFMEDAAQALASNGIATLRYQFPYTERGSKRIDPKPQLLATVRAAVECARELGKGLPLIAGGKSMGGRMTSLAASENPLPGVRGIVFFGFPLHPAGERSTARAEHLLNVTVPMLFLQGTRDALADLTLLKPICKKLNTRATLHIVNDADHSFHVPKRSGTNDKQVLTDLAVQVAAWSARVIR
ncbi:MAG: alpha/beta family hydrolase [bacterium]